MGFTPSALEDMGFRRQTSGESIVASFQSIHIYEIQGLSFADGVVLESSGALNGAPYRLGVGSALNVIARKLIDDDLTDDEAAWMEEHKCTPPFVFVYIGPTTQHLMAGDFLKIEESGITTYEAFTPARNELRNLENIVLPNIISSLTCAFRTVESHVEFKKLSREVFGRTLDGTFVYDFGFEFRALISVDKAIAIEDLKACLIQTTQLATIINPDISRFFQLALEEDDSLKRFLYFFLTIERQTFTTFIKSHDKFIKSHDKKLPPLPNCFMWCVTNVWNHLDNSDVATFKQLKEIRNQIAHGNIASPPEDAVFAIERLAVKLQMGASNTI